MGKELTTQEHEIIQQLILDRWNPHRINQKIANHFGLSVNQVRHIRRKQLAIYKDSFDDVFMGGSSSNSDRAQRVGGPLANTHQ